jgi:hypothetical protein
LVAWSGQVSEQNRLGLAHVASLAVAVFFANREEEQTLRSSVIREPRERFAYRQLQWRSRCNSFFPSAFSFSL